MVRFPDPVLDRAFAEAPASLTPEIIAYCSLSCDEVIAELSLNFDEVVLIGWALQNLALLGDFLDGTSALTDQGVTTDTALLATMLLGATSDKTLPISADKAAGAQWDNQTIADLKIRQSKDSDRTARSFEGGGDSGLA
ncbi:MAG: hypothetical protein C0524_14565 [Rhodobacter sp.]|nr:hypothetical protein [Rhodobacter sp.]